jgi:nitroreductase
MDFTDVIRGRSSVRHFSDAPVSDEQVARVIEEASWAPSPGNTQPWKVAVLSEQRSARLIEQFELEGWESVFPTLRLVISQQLPRPLPPAELDELVFKLFREQIQVTGRPRVLVIYYDRRSFREWARLVRSAIAMALARLRKKSLSDGLRYILARLLRVRGDFRIAHETVLASLACFTYGLTLSAYGQGLQTCIQFSYNHVSSLLRGQLGLRAGQELFGVVLLGHAQEAGHLTALSTRSRKAVDTRHVS